MKRNNHQSSKTNHQTKAASDAPTVKDLKSTHGEGVVKVTTCARCGGDHILLLNQFKHPIIDSGGTKWTRWAMCPESHDPILWRAVSTRKKQAPTKPATKTKPSALDILGPRPSSRGKHARA